MNYGPKQYYVKTSSVPTAPKKEGINVYFRNAEGKLGQFNVATTSHKDAILTAREELVAGGDGLENKAVLAVIKGGK